MAIGLRTITFGQHDIETQIMEPKGLIEIVDQQCIRVAVVLKPLHERVGNRIKIGEDDVAAYRFRQLPRRPGFRLRLHPRRVEELNKRERQQNKQEDHSGKKHDNGERPPRVAGERDVAEA